MAPSSSGEASAARTPGCTMFTEARVMSERGVKWHLTLLRLTLTRHQKSNSSSIAPCRQREGQSIESAIFGAATKAVSSFTRGSEPGRSPAQRLQHATLTWQHPDTCLPAACVATLVATKAGAAMMQARTAARLEAYRSLYLALRCNACSAFYLLSPQVDPPHSTTSTAPIILVRRT